MQEEEGRGRSKIQRGWREERDTKRVEGGARYKEGGGRSEIRRGWREERERLVGRR